MKINEIKNLFFNFLKSFKCQNDLFVLLNYLDIVLMDIYRNDYNKFKGISVCEFISYIYAFI